MASFMNIFLFYIKLDLISSFFRVSSGKMLVGVTIADGGAAWRSGGVGFVSSLFQSDFALDHPSGTSTKLALLYVSFPLSLFV